jgi:hypothetical protein
MLNEIDVFEVDRRISKRACIELARIMSDNGRYRDYLAPKLRASLLAEMQCGNEFLCRKFGMLPFPALSEQSLRAWTLYPGLSTERAIEFASHHARVRRSAGYQVERLAILVRKATQRRLSLLAWTIPAGRVLLSQLRHLRRRAKRCP